MFTEGKQWHDQRLLLQPSFTPTRIRSHTETIQRATETAASEWQKEKTIDLRARCSELTLSILADTLFPIDLTTERGTIVRNVVTALADEVDSSLVQFLPEWAPRTPTERRFDRAMAALDELIEQLIDEHQRTDSEYDDLLSVLLTADDSVMDDATVRDQLVTFLFAGHETTALALTYSLWLLSGHPAVRQQLNQKRIEHVINEALRLYPPAYSLYREPQDVVDLGGYRIERGTTIEHPVYTVHRDPRWWDDPDAFVPERWEQNTNRPEYAYFPFGGGPRHCIGMRFAMDELKIALSILAQRFDFERVTESIDPSPRMLLDPGRVMVRVKNGS